MNDYFKMLEQWFETSNRPTTYHSKEYWEAKYEEIKIKKEKFRDVWNRLLIVLSKLDLFFRVKDMDLVTELYCYRVILPFKTQSEEGIILNISMVENLFGFYYADYSKKAPIPVRSYLGEVHDYLSYYPFSLRQEKIGQKITPIIHELTAFSCFNPLNASLLCEEIFIAGDVYKKIDLFQVFFGKHLYGML